MIKPTLVFVLALSFAPSARADLAPPSPEMMDCPNGATGTLPPVPAGALDPRGRPLRPWPYCAPTTCASDADCSGGRVCSAQEVGLCVETQEVTGGTVRVARDRGCEPDGTCLNVQSTCESARRCVTSDAAPPAPPSSVAPPPTTEAPPPSATPAPEPESSGWGCSAGSRESSTLSALTMALALFALRRRKR